MKLKQIIALAASIAIASQAVHAQETSTATKETTKQMKDGSCGKGSCSKTSKKKDGSCGKGSCSKMDKKDGSCSKMDKKEGSCSKDGSCSKTDKKAH
jgi:hypothetical protein